MYGRSGAAIERVRLYRLRNRKEGYHEIADSEWDCN